MQTRWFAKGRSGSETHLYTERNQNVDSKGVSALNYIKLWDL